jgi:uncharacterized protein GlcG (DUF336 family)
LRRAEGWTLLEGNSMSRISLAQANGIIDAALAKGVDLGLKPLAVVVVDAGGHDIAVQRQDGASILRPQIARAKASGALGLGVSSRKIGEIAAERPTFVATLGVIAPLGALPAAGGLIIVDGDGAPIGAVGVTGDTSDNDELCAAAGITAAGLIVQA